MQGALVDSNGIVQNFIVYDANYTPPAGFTVQQVNSWVQMGQNINTAEPAPPAPSPTPIPDLATQLANVLIAKGTIAATDLNAATLTTVNTSLTAAGLATIK
jgi:hypothetical protein